MLPHFASMLDGSWKVCNIACMQADLMFMPFMERFAIAMPAFTPYDPCTACDGTMGYWLAEMEQLECCQMAAPDQELFLHALRYASGSMQYSSPKFSELSPYASKLKLLSHSPRNVLCSASAELG